MFHKDGNRRRTWKGRAFSLFLSAALLLGSVPGLVLPASAHWADSYLDQLVDWGVMRADQISNPDTPLTRAEFMAIINRAYGYQEIGEMPFTDVSKSDWFYDDVAIAYNAGYMKGTSKTTASPNARLTREQAICILGRNMMLKETPGEDLAFSDSRDISGWARGMVKTAVNNYIVTGYPDDSFRPKSNITKGQMAVLVTQCVGTPVNASGTYELGDVSGNVTVTAPNVTLRNTTVSGDLYISGGVGLGGIKLENVNVLGRIVVSGTGESENGSASVIMRNVNANELLVDNMRKKYVTVRADGITEIPRTIVRTNAYLEDNNTDDKGLLNISLEGASGTRLDLAGRIKNVVDKTPDSFIQVAKGSVQSITVDEAATNSVIQINRNTEVKELNLDVATNVNGEGDVGKLNINAPGSTVTMLPDEIYIRPGITGNVNGTEMDSAAAEESSLDPRLLSGYPAANDVAPTGFRADFAGNKKGTVYWAVSNIADGSIGAEDLISPPSYGSKAVRGGSVGVPAGDTVGSTQISGLTVGGSYYLSAVLVDGRGERSPVKVISFTTPDNTVPAFAQGYPYMSLVTNTMAQVTVMPTKTCKLYYAVLLRGAPAPTASELRSASVTGNLGYGIVDVVKNTERVINVSNRLQELKEYTLYLWLTDADGVNSSAVVPVQFKTVDKTPPEFDPDPDPDAAVEENTSVKMTAGLNEPGTIYWVAVPKGKPYPPVNPGSDPIDKDNIMSGSYDENGTLIDPNGGTPVSSRLTSRFAMDQVKYHKGNVTAFGSVPVANAGTEVNIDVRNLKEATAYDFYYVAQDTAGNFSKEVKKITIKTKDTVGPVVTQCFRDATQGKDILIPKSGDVVVLKFNEDIKAGGMGGLLDLSAADLKKALEKNFKLYYLDAKGDPQPVGTDKSQSTTWVDYSKVTVSQGQNGVGGIEVVFDPAQGALKMVSGRTYYFELTGITDLSNNNPKGFEQANSPVLRYDTIDRTEHVLGMFTVAPASVKLSKPADGAPIAQPDWVANPDKDPINKAGYESGGTRDTDIKLARVDGTFYVDPESTSEMGNDYYYDIVLFSEKAIDYDVYYRVRDPEHDYDPVEDQDEFEKYSLRTDDMVGNDGWAYLGNVKSDKTSRQSRDVSGLNRDAVRDGYKAELKNLSQLKKLSQDVRYEFAISVTKLNGSSNFSTWGDKFQVYVSVIAGGKDQVDSVIKTGNATEETIIAQPGISVISDPLHITMDFSKFDAPPMFEEGPVFTPYYDGKPTAQITFSLNNPGTLYYMIVPQGEPLDTTEIKTKLAVKTDTETIGAGTTITAAEADKNRLWAVVSAQTALNYTAGRLETDGFLKYYSVQGPDSFDISASGKWIDYTGTDGRRETVTLEYKDDEQMTAKNGYYIYIVLGSDSSNQKSNVYIYNFTAGDMGRPKISARQDGKDLRVNTGRIPNKDDTPEDAKNNGMPTKFNWMILQKQTALKKDWLGADFKFTPATGEPASYGVVKTLEDALKTTFNSDEYYRGSSVTGRTYGEEWNGYTVFDVLASDDDKKKVYTPITDNDIEGLQPYIVSNLMYTREDRAEEQYLWTGDWYNVAKNKFGDNVDRTQYLVLIVGRNSLSNHKGAEIPLVSSYRVVSPVEIADKSTPKLSTANISLNFNDSMTGWDGVGYPTLRGNISLSFEAGRALAWTPIGDTEQYTVTGGDALVKASDDVEATVGLLYRMPAGHPFTCDKEEGPTDFYLTFDKATGNAYQVLRNGSFYAKGATSPGGPLRIEFDIHSEMRDGVRWWIGQCDVIYAGNDPQNSGREMVIGSAKIERSEYDLKGTTPPVTPTPTPPAVTTANITPVSSLSSGVGEAKVELFFDQDVYAKSGSKLSRVTTGKKLTVNVPITGKEKVQEIPVEIQDGNLYESTGQAYTDEPIKIKVTIDTGNMGITRPIVEVYFGDKLVQKKQLS